MLQGKINQEKDLANLMLELDSISGDLSKYVNFLVARQDLMRQVLADSPPNNN